MRKLLFFILGMALLVCAMDASLDFFYFAGPGKERAIQILRRHLHPNIDFDTIRFRLLTGFALRNVTVKDPQTNEPILLIEKIHAQPEYRPILSRKLVLKKLELKNLNFKASGRHSFSLASLKWPYSEKIHIKKIFIKNGGLVTPSFQMSDISSKMKISRKGKIHGFISGVFKQEKGSESWIQTHVNLNLNNKNLSFEGEAVSFPVAFFEPYLKTHFADLRGLSGAANIHFQAQGNLLDLIHIQTTITSPLWQIVFTPWQWEGGIELNAKSQYHFLKKEWGYKGEIDIKDASLHSSLLPSPVSQIQGKFLFENQFLTTNGVEGYFEGKSIRGRGSIEKSDKPKIHASLFTDLEPEKFLAVAKIIHPSLFKKFSVTGKSFTQVHINTNEADGKLNWEGTLFLKEVLFQMERPSLTYRNLTGPLSFKNKTIFFKELAGELTIDAEKKNKLQAKASLQGEWSFENGNSLVTATLTKGTFFSPWLQNRINDFESQIVFSPNKIEIPSFSGKAYSAPFHGESLIHLTDKGKPEISFYLASSEYSLLFQGVYEKRKVHIHKLSGYGFGTTFDISGTASPSIQEPWNITACGKVDTDTLKKAWPLLWEKVPSLAQWNPKGTIETKGFWRGSPAKKETWSTLATFTGKRVEIKNLFFDDFYMQTSFKNKMAQYKNIKGVLGEGVLNANLVFDFKQKPSAYSIEVEAKNVDIINIPRFFEKNTEDFKLEGPFDGKLLLKGRSKKPETVIGWANINITDGRLWDSPLLKPIWLTIRTFSPKLEKPVFKSAQADFKIDNQLLQTENLELKSPGLILKAEGTIGFDQSVDMLFNIKFLKPEGPTVKILAAKGLNLFGKLLEIEYKGTLSEPVVKRRWLPMLDKLVSSQ